MEGTGHLSQGASEGGAEVKRHLFLPPYTGSVTAACWQQDCGGWWREEVKECLCRGQREGTHPGGMQFLKPIYLHVWLVDQTKGGGSAGD